MLFPLLCQSERSFISIPTSLHGRPTAYALRFISGRTTNRLCTLLADRAFGLRIYLSALRDLMRRKEGGRVHSMAAAKVAIVAKLGPSTHGAKNDEVAPHIARTRPSPPARLTSTLQSLRSQAVAVGITCRRPPRRAKKITAMNENDEMKGRDDGGKLGRTASRRRGQREKRGEVDRG